MSLTKEQIEEWRIYGNNTDMPEEEHDSWNALCDMALRAAESPQLTQKFWDDAARANAQVAAQQNASPQMPMSDEEIFFIARQHGITAWRGPDNYQLLDFARAVRGEK